MTTKKTITKKAAKKATKKASVKKKTATKKTPAKKTPAKKSLPKRAGPSQGPKPCQVKVCFDCNGDGSTCNCCGELMSNCCCADECDVALGTQDCETCQGAGGMCVEHESPCGDFELLKRCDKVKAMTPREAKSRG